MRATSLVQQGQGLQGAIDSDVDAEWEPSMLMTINATRPNTPATTSSCSSQRPHVHSTSPFQRSIRSIPSHPPTNSTAPYPIYPHNPNNPFDVVLPRGLLHRIIDLYFDYVYCLIPCLHRPTFLHDLHAHREEQPDEEEWTVMVFCVVVATLVQLPRAFVPMPRKDVKDLVERCYALGREYLNRDYKEVSVTRCTSRIALKRRLMRRNRCYAIPVRFGESQLKRNADYDSQHRVHCCLDRETARRPCPVRSELDGHAQITPA